MPDKEKVIKGLKCHYEGWKSSCEFCPYKDEWACQISLCGDALALLKEQPEIVRCKDCFYADAFDCPAPLPTGYLCQKRHSSHMGDFFCSDGERKEDQ